MRQKIDCIFVRLCAPLILFLVLSFSASAQHTVTGKVTSAKDGLPIGFATITVKGTKVATVTEADGSFTINVPAGSNTLVVSSVGYAITEANAASGVVNVTLSENTSSLDEIVVTGYTAQRKKDLTGSVAVVNVSNLKSVPSGTTESLLQGQASGVTVINSGNPGGGSSVYIRGITSVGNVDPLVIIDGTPGSLHDLNVNDIESIQVLKDAGAASIYGVRGSNGVVIVTTKRGKQGSARVTYDGFVGTQQPLKDGFNLANTQETANAYVKQYENDGIPNGNKQFKQAADGSGIIPDYITPTAAMEGDPNTDPSTYALYDNPITKANKIGTDWFHEIFKPALFQSHTVSASGGSDKSTYYFSTSYLDQQGTLVNTYLKRYSARINTTFNIKDHIRIGENAYVFYKQNPGFTNQNEGNAISMSYREDPVIPVRDIAGNYAGTISQGLGNAQNPVAIVERTENNKSNDWQVNGNVFAEVDLPFHLTARTSFGGNFDNYYYYFFNYTAYENAENNTNANSFHEASGYNSSWTWTNTLNFSDVFGKHNVKALIGSEAISNYGRFIQADRSDYFLTNPANLTVDPSLWTINFGSPSSQTNNSDGAPYQSSLYSLFARVDYNFDDKYLISGTVRRDGSSNFAPGQQFGVFPAVTAGWRISQENFMKGVTWLDDLKIRGGWGKLGSLSNTPSTNAYNLYNQAADNSYYDIEGKNTSATLGVYASQYGFPATTWEKDKITNIGLDATVFKRKLDLSVEYYKKSITDLLFQLSLPGTAGGGTPPYINLGDIRNQGVDASATYHSNIGKDLKLDITGTFTSYNNKVIKLPFNYVDEGSSGSGRLGAFSRLQVGQPVGEFFGYQVVGIFNDADQVKGAAVQEGAAPGRFMYRDVDGNDTINSNDRTFFGNPNPKFTYGFTLSASYKNFDLSVFLYGSQGNKVMNYVRFWVDFPQVFDGAVSKDAVYNSWTPQNTNAKVPQLSRNASFSTTGSGANSYFMEDGSYLRCKSMVLGYTVPVNPLKRIGVDRLRIYVQAANLFTITKYTGLDPELQASDLNNNTNFGIDFGNYPANQKTYTVGVNLSF